MGCCFVVAIIYNIPRFLEFRTVPFHEVENTLREEDITNNRTVGKEISEVCSEVLKITCF